MRIELFDFDLPRAFIAQQPASPRDSGHCLQMEIPATLASTQDVTITLGGQSTTISDAIVRNTPAANVIFAVDTSSSLGTGVGETFFELLHALECSSKNRPLLAAGFRGVGSEFV